MKRPKQLLVTMPLGEDRLLSGFLETSVEDCEHSGHPYTGCTEENMDKFAKSLTKTDEVPF
jgi:hypothetical protein